jgi:ubiquitin C-terminal hydrolase
MYSSSKLELTKFVDKGLTGLANLGNTCFMNAAIQCLSHTYEFSHFLDTIDYRTLLTKKPESLLIVEWDELRQLMWKENCIISPGGFLSNVQRIAKLKDKQIFTGFAQNDLPEFVMFLIDCFHNAIQREVIIKISGTVKDTKDELALSCYTMMKNMYQKEYSELLDIFYGIHVSMIADMSGAVLQSTPEPFFMLNLPIPALDATRTPTLLDCMEAYTLPEHLTGDNQWYNDKTKEKQDVLKRILFFNLPKVLIIDLKRFDNRMRKNNVLVDFPLDGLDLSPYVIGYKKEHFVYELYGVCNHMGNAFGGHYTAFVKNANGKWYHFNDTRVQEVPDASKVITNQAYCFFYRKKNKSS